MPERPLLVPGPGGGLAAEAAGLFADERAQREEAASALTHAAGALAALLAGAILVVLVVLRGDGWQVASAIVFSICLFLLYLASALYHSARSPVARRRLKVFDHCAIYLLIAGSYTPFTLVALRDTVGWWLFGTVWTLALAGVVFKLFYTGRFRLLSTGIYVAMGWLVLVAIKPVMASLDAWAFGWMVAGGVFYTGGTYFYHRASIPYSHAIWHLFCIAGSASHFVAVTTQVLPPR
ncbi:MAG TPA: hemolysin III family protein [Luteimonas sp.]|nr:hemolysin III family protein [Luteimonas sp.]